MPDSVNRASILIAVSPFLPLTPDGSPLTSSTDGSPLTASKDAKNFRNRFTFSFAFVVGRYLQRRPFGGNHIN